jgi:hypothetical protein
VSEIKKEILNSNRHLIFIIFIALFSIILLLSPFILWMRIEKKKKNAQPFHKVIYTNVINSQEILSMPESSIISKFQILNNKYFSNSKILKG